MNRREAIQRAGLVLGYAVTAPVLAGLLKGCKPVPELAFKPVFFNDVQAGIVSEVAEIIIPKTDTPGAKDLGIPGYVDRLIKECYKKEDQDRFLAGLQEFDDQAKATMGDSFMDLDVSQQQAYVKTVHDRTIDEHKALEEIRKTLVGKRYMDPLTAELVEKYGPMDSVPSTNGKRRTAYFKKGNFNMETDKMNDDILSVSRKTPFILNLKELTVVGFFLSEKGATEVLQYQTVPGAFRGCQPLAEVGKTWAT